MQLIWVSGPTARVVTWSITRVKVWMALGAVVCGCLLLGGVFQWVGLRVAVEHVPELAHSMGGVTSEREQRRVQAQYQDQLERLQQQLRQTIERQQQLEASRQAFFAQIGLGMLAQPAAKGDRLGRGGPLRTLPAGLPEQGRGTWPQQLIDTTRQLDAVQQWIEQSHEGWSQQQRQLSGLPLGLPVQGSFQLSSAFGVRHDPITRMASLHEGTDFTAAVGTPVVATAAGEVVQAHYSGAYGNLVELAHAEGFVTRYAHLQSMAVQAGQMVRLGERLGSVGNTGRSTGPHLHYEVLFRGQPMHPIQAVQAWSRF